MKRLLNSLRFRLIVLVLLAALPAFLLVLTAGLNNRAAAEQDAKRNALNIARLAAGAEQTLISGARQTLTVLARLPAIRPGADTEACSFFLRGLNANYPRYAGFIAAASDGAVYCSSTEYYGDGNISREGIFRQVLEDQEFVIGTYSFEPFVGVPVLPFGYPVRDDNGEVIAVLLALLSLDWLNALVPDIELPPGATLLVVDAQGNVLARHPLQEDLIGQNLPDEPIIAAILERGREGTVRASGLDGEDRLNAFTPLVGRSSQVIFLNVGIPAGVAYAGVNEVMVSNLIALALVMIVAFAATWVVSDALFLRQIRALLGATRRIASGDFSARSQLVVDEGELGRLGAAFDHMAQTLHDREVNLQQAEARYRTLVEQLPAATYIVDWEDGNFLYVSPQLEEMTGYKLDEWVIASQLWGDRLHPGDKQRVMNALSQAHHELTSLNLEYRMYRADGSYVWVRDESVPLHDDAGIPRIRQGLIIDISERKQTEASLKSYARQLEQSNRELENFAFITSHDLQEPLRKIQAFGERIESKYAPELDETGRDYLQRMVAAASRMQTLITDLLAYSRVDTRGKPFVKVDLTDIVQDVISSLEMQIRETRGQVKVDPLPVVEADPTQMYQLFQNLISNALKFHKAGEPPEVRISAAIVDGDDRRNGSIAAIRVQDRGIGFEERYLDRIFQPFRRLHSPQKYPGSGIGLAICRKIVERHNGSLTAESALGEGAVFTVRIPTGRSTHQEASN